ncbi:hypothetical protein [Luteolibacter marinus]|uniref:hypothetical protein n=1 Tax=Luteolibacter marinus TaxID=2776705 RepID=UPI0018674C62|nr:hypothetical protein [Luteolibacter marinus]
MPSRVHLPCFAVVTLCHLAHGQEPLKAVPVESDPTELLAPEGYVAKPQADAKAVSRSGMFRVGGGEYSQRSSVALFLESTRDEFEALLRDRDDAAAKAADKRGSFAEAARKNDEFDVAVNVTLQGKQGDPPQPKSVVYELGYTDEAFSLGIQIHLARGIDNELLERAALTVLLYERALRGVRPEGFDERLVVRPWLVEGLSEAMKWRAGTADRRIYEGVFRQGGGFTLDELFELKESSYRKLDGASRLAFRALSGALVMALLEQPQGREAFRGFTGEAARFAGEMPILLRKHFPELNLSERSLAKWWALTLAKLVEPKLSEALSIAETERDFNDTLQFHLRSAEGGMSNLPLDEWQKIAAMEAGDRAEAIHPAEAGLIRLSYRCFPSYRPLLSEYQLILRDLAVGETKDIGLRLEELKQQREIRMERANRARDYLDFIEISQARSLSGEFEDYMRLKQELELRPRPPRHDRLSEVLDFMQGTYEPRKKR